jgi:hypothetical protein
LVDIFSIVKDAANEQHQPLDAKESVKLACVKVTAGKTFTPDQQQWLRGASDK